MRRPNMHARKANFTPPSPPPHLSRMPLRLPSSSHRGLALGAAASRAFLRLRSSASRTYGRGGGTLRMEARLAKTTVNLGSQVPEAICPSSSLSPSLSTRSNLP